MIAIFDEDGGGDVDFQEFVQGLSAFSSKGDKEQKLKFAFKVYDIDRDGYISNGELFIVLKMMVGSNLKDQQLQQIVDKTIMEADLDKDGKISFEEFVQMVGNTDVSMSMTLGEFLRRVGVIAGLSLPCLSQRPSGYNANLCPYRSNVLTLYCGRSVLNGLFLSYKKIPWGDESGQQPVPPLRYDWTSSMVWFRGMTNITESCHPRRVIEPALRDINSAIKQRVDLGTAPFYCFSELPRSCPGDLALTMNLPAQNRAVFSVIDDFRLSTNLPKSCQSDVECNERY